MNMGQTWPFLHWERQIILNNHSPAFYYHLQAQYWYNSTKTYDNGDEATKHEMDLIFLNN